MWFFSVCYGNEIVGTTTKDLGNTEVQRCAGEGEGGGTSSLLQGCAHGARALSYSAAPALLADAHFIPQAQHCECSGQAQLLDVSPSLSCIRL